ncbi:glycoside hydrolase family 18 protein [Lacibacter luteus]|uniref:chitinase n=1 Tax=Lacibacter luteus TaxID=2508719 RepID=A0A4Q1CEW2_9BACT|nr:glycoside hydrolase family 18 protein [Lacibacter luteus]RXK58082.1 glycoside hydrolase family 18 protein [Lacibacter luteus]
MKKQVFSILLFVLTVSICSAQKQTAKSMEVIAYYAGGSEAIDKFKAEQLTQIIFSFGHLKGNRLHIGSARDTATIHKLVALKKRNAKLKVLLSLGGWSGCAPCSDVFSTAAGRKEFAASVKELLQFFKADGIDLDWEYPAIEGYPGHTYRKEDKDNFTSLVQLLRTTLGKEKIISFAAGGFDEFLQESIDWKKVMPVIDFVNMMTYDFVGGYSKVTGHHTSLYSTGTQKRSADNVIRYFESINAPLQKIIIGAAFYARTWQGVNNSNNGLYQAGTFKDFVSFSQFKKHLNSDSGFVYYRDPVAQAPYAYNNRTKIFATFDDEVSVAAKVNYVQQKKLGGIMFWELSLDKPANGLLQVITDAKNK